MQRKNLLWLTVLTLAGLAVLVGLGIWQLKRLEWKQGLIAKIETRAKSDPIALKQAIAALEQVPDDPGFGLIGRL